MRLTSKISLAMVAMVSVGGVAHAQTMSPTDYVAMAGAGDQYEMQSSKLVMRSTTDPKIRSFATMMIADHTKSTAMVKHAAMKDGLHPMPPMLDADGKMMMSELTSAKGKARDSLYMTQQKTAHDKALELHQGYSANGTSPALKMAATDIAPVVQHHIDMLAAMPASAM